MKVLMLIIPFAFSCQSQKQLVVGVCVIGTRMVVWNLLRKEEGRFMFTTLPAIEGAPVEIVTDITAFKRVDCPQE
jgi:hypothetical protein